MFVGADRMHVSYLIRNKLKFCLRQIIPREKEIHFQRKKRMKAASIGTTIAAKNTNEILD